MIRLSMVLLGNDFVRKRWSALALTSIVWGAAGVAIFIDALDGVLYFPLHVFGYLLLLEALIILLVPAPQTGTAAALRKVRGLAFLVLGLLIVDRQHAAGRALQKTAIVRKPLPGQWAGSRHRAGDPCLDTQRHR